VWSQLFTLFIRFPYSLVQIGRLLRQERVDVVNVHYPNLGCAAFLVLRACSGHRLNIILSFHGQDAHAIHNESNWLRRKVWRMVLVKSDVLVGCSERHAHEIAALLDIDAARSSSSTTASTFRTSRDWQLSRRPRRRAAVHGLPDYV